MNAVYSLCDGTDGCLISPFDVMSVLPARKKYTAGKVENALQELKNEGYLDLISSERKGERMYVVSLKESGQSFKSGAKQKRQELLNKIFMAFVGAVATFIFGLILKAVFGG